MKKISGGGWNRGLKVWITKGSYTKPNTYCLKCNIHFHAKPDQLRRGKGKYCSKACYMKVRSQWMKDKNFNPAYKVDFSGSKNPNYRNAKRNCMDCNIPFSYAKETLRCAKCNYKFYSGPNHHMWIPDKVRFYPASWNSTFKWQIRHRDGYKCQMCGIPQAECKTNLPVHHIDYDKLNIKSENLVSLCNSCHAKTNFNREYWKQYFSGKEVKIAYADNK